MMLAFIVFASMALMEDKPSIGIVSAPITTHAPVASANITYPPSSAPTISASDGSIFNIVATVVMNLKCFVGISGITCPMNSSRTTNVTIQYNV